MLPFDVDIRPGASVHQQVVHAVEHALVEGRLAPGDRFLSVRALSKELRINPNTAHKIVSTLVDAGVLEVRPGIGTLISQQPQTADPRQIELLLGPRLERTVVEARRLGLGLEDVQDALARHWRALMGAPQAASPPAPRRRRKKA